MKVIVREHIPPTRFERLVEWYTTLYASNKPLGIKRAAGRVCLSCDLAWMGIAHLILGCVLGGSITAGFMS